MRKLNFAQTPQGDLIIKNQAQQNNTSRYDSYVVLTTETIPATIPFFQIPLGQAGSGFVRTKTYNETNMQVARRLENPVAGTVRRIVVSVIPFGTALNAIATTTLVKNVIEDSIVRLTVSDVKYYEIHLTWCGGTGITGMVDNAAAADGYCGAHPGIAGRQDLIIPVPIRSREQFAVEIVRNTNNTLLDDALPANTNLLYRVYLEGTFTRPLDA